MEEINVYNDSILDFVIVFLFYLHLFRSFLYFNLRF